MSYPETALLDGGSAIQPPSTAPPDAARPEPQTPLRQAPDSLAPYATATRWRAWPAFGMAVVVVLTLQVLGGFIIGFAQALMKRKGGIDVAAWNLAVTLLSHVVTAWWVLRLARSKGDTRSKMLAWTKPAGGFWAYLGAPLLLLILLSIYSLSTIFFLQHDPKVDQAAMLEMLKGSRWWLWLLIAAVTAPISEELLFRGFLQTALTPSRLGFWGASLVTSTFWTLLHAYSIVGMIQIFLCGLFFSWMLRLTGSLRVALACHVVMNSVVVLALLFMPPNLLPT